MIKMIPSSSSSNQANEAIDTTGSHDTSDNKTHDIDGSCDSSDAVTMETDNTIVKRTNLKCDVERDVPGSHDAVDDDTAEGSIHDPNRSVILNKIYQKY